MMTTTPSATKTNTGTSTSKVRDSVKSELDPNGWRMGFQSLAREHGFEPLRVEGKIPEDLVGTFYRNGPGAFEVAGDRNRHWFDGDGAVMGYRIDGRRNTALGGSRMVATPGRAKEQRANKRLYGGYNTPMVRPFHEIVLRDNKNPANTSVLIHDDRLYAICEAGKPFEISTEDLSTLGVRDFDGAVRVAFSAHPHRAPSRNTTYGFGLGRAGRTTPVEVHALEDGKPGRRIATFTVDGFRTNHDFAITDRHLIFFFAPLYFSVWGVIMKRGFQDASTYRRERGTEIVVIPIDNPEKIARFHVDAFYMEHTVNAFELPNGEIAVDYVHYDDISGLEDWAGSVASGTVKGPLRSSIHRGTINVAKKSFRHEVLLDEAVELPRITPLRDTERHDVMYALAFDQNQLAPPTVILKQNLKEGRVTRYDAGEGCYPSEAVFVPRRTTAGAGGDEDDGYLLTSVLDTKLGTTHLQILDAQRLEEGPLARCHFDHAIPFGFHGAWHGAPSS